MEDWGKGLEDLVFGFESDLEDERMEVLHKGSSEMCFYGMMVFGI